MADDLAAFGIQADLPEPEDTDFDVWEENWAAVEFFCGRLVTCWRVGPMGGVVGLDYPGVKAVMDLMGITDQKNMFEQLQLMERAVLPIFNQATNAKA